MAGRAKGRVLKRQRRGSEGAGMSRQRKGEGQGAGVGGGHTGVIKDVAPVQGLEGGIALVSCGFDKRVVVWGLGRE